MRLYKYFYGGPFSNFWIQPFTIDGVEFNCNEQYFMWSKAKFFKDEETAELILKEVLPEKQKALGRKVKNYDDSKWNEVREYYMYKGLQAKFSYEQNPTLYNSIIRACMEFELLVEASPTDKIWGIGFNSYDAPGNEDKWGLNLLGKQLTKLGLEFIAEQAED